VWIPPKDVKRKRGIAAGVSGPVGKQDVRGAGWSKTIHR
jgi:hypothetical protein